MDRDRRRDIPPEDQYGTGRGQSYRPGNARERSPPPSRIGGDSYRARSPPRRADYMDSYKADTYRAPRDRSRSPPRRDDDRLPLPVRRDDERLPPRRDDFRRRSPSAPRYRPDDRALRGGDSYRGRPRSPLTQRREELPRDDLFRREPVRDERDFRDTRDRDFREDRDRERHRPYVVPGRSPVPRFRDRSQVALKRARDPSPISSRGRRSPPPAKRERLGSPARPRYDDHPPSRGVSPPRRRYSPEPRERRGYSPTVRGATRGYRLRSRSPLAGNNERVDPRSVDDWRRPRSPAPRQDYPNREESGVTSAATSRRSSPPLIHPSRLAHLPANDRAPSGRATPLDAYDAREPCRASAHEHRARSPLPAQEPVYNERVYETDREAVPPPRERRRDDDQPLPVRQVPTGPSSQRAPATSMTPPTGPAAATSLPSGPRAAGPPPSGPRGSQPTRGDFAPRGRGGFGPDFAPRGRGGMSGGFRGGRGGFSRGGSEMGGFGRGEANFGGTRTFSDSFSPPTGPAAGVQPPSGPRSSFSSGQVPVFARQQSASAAPPSGPRSARFGPSTSSNNIGNTIGDTDMPDAPTGPKAFRRPTEPTIPTAPAHRPHPALADLPRVIEGGVKVEPVVDRSKLSKLEEDAEKIRRQIEEKEAKKRHGLRDWERLSRAKEAAEFRSELAKEALESLNGEVESQAAF